MPVRLEQAVNSGWVPLASCSFTSPSRLGRRNAPALLSNSGRKGCGLLSTSGRWPPLLSLVQIPLLAHIDLSPPAYPLTLTTSAKQPDHRLSVITGDPGHLIQDSSPLFPTPPSVIPPRSNINETTLLPWVTFLGVNSHDCAETGNFVNIETHGRFSR